MDFAVVLTILFPLLFSISGFFFNVKKLFFFPVIASVLSFVSSIFVFINGESSIKLYTWFSAKGVGNVDFSFRTDKVSASFALMVTFVAMLIHIYSIGYMKNDPEKNKFFGLLNLFLASMLILIFAGNLAIMFLGWEGVGLASYLLIGFWNYNKEYAVAAKKAFLVNKIGDVCFLLALGFLILHYHSLEWNAIFDERFKFKGWTIIVFPILILLAACAKSAQFPLQSWLSDAMAGPTPVSALIHAATMVTAGVYLVVRMGPFFYETQTTKLIVVIVGGISILFGAFSGSAKDDMKKVLASSTMSQIGYMMLAAGLGPVGATFALMHLIIHGFFKAGLFLGAGNIMHALNDNTNIKKMGQLRVVMKVSFICFICSYLAILGVPPFAGYWSKDKIIADAFAGTGPVVWITGIVTLIGAGVTAFYMSRLFFLIFLSKKNYSSNQKPHEMPLVMNIPIIILSVGSIFLGLILTFLKFPEKITNIKPLGTFEFKTVIPENYIVFSTLFVVLLGILCAYKMYIKKNVVQTVKYPRLKNFLALDFDQDKFNNIFIVKPGEKLVSISNFIDISIVDKFVMSFGSISKFFSKKLLKAQNGYVRASALYLIGGILLIVIIVLLGGVFS